MDQDSIARGSVSQWLSGLLQGDGEAVRRLWGRYFPSMVRLAKARGAGADAEDAALGAFWDLCRQAPRFPRLGNRSDLWKLLACFTAREAFDAAAKERKRTMSDEGLDAVPDREPPPEFAAALAEMLEYLPDDSLRAVAIGKLEGRTHPEIARQLGCALATVERKARLIRLLWEEA